LALLDTGVAPLINPEITWKSDETYVDQEGCLSLPGVWLDITRSKEIIVGYMDPAGKKQERKLTDFAARVVQHEVDHLDGILIVDYRKKDTRNETQETK
ncbi:peptide deformylase, partial [Candidatus Peregrinibacteria bacterium]|nr:peptide deformylase [Candidatus Peregrinibacteria bacterium]